MPKAKRGLRQRRKVEQGFTLVEMMIVVVIVGVLALLATYSVTKYVASSKTSEAFEMIGVIKAAEETYKDETFTYLDVTSNLSTFYPSDPAYGMKSAWGGGNATINGNWQTLGVTAANPVVFGYACMARPTGAPTQPGSEITIGNWPTTGTVPWYVVEARADLNGDGRKTVFVGTSFSGEIYAQNN